MKKKINYDRGTIENFFKYCQKNFNYGWIDQDGKRHEGVNDGKLYSLQSPEELMNSKLGICGELVKGAESATGMLVIGSTDYLMKKDHIEKYMQKNGMTEDVIKLKLRQALRDLNYSYAHIQIVLYDELLNNLEKFFNQMNIEMNI